MRNRFVRIFIVLAALAAGAASAYTVRGIDRQMTSERAAEQALRDQARALVAAIADARAGQQAYVAQGQGADFWSARVSSLVTALDQRLRAFGASLGSDAARATLESATAAIEDFRKLDAKAQEYVQAGQYLMASDFIFSDGLEATAAAATQIDLALGQELQARGVAYANLRQRLLVVLGAASGAILLALLLLLPTGRRAESSESAELHIAPKLSAAQITDRAHPPALPAEEAVALDLTGTARLCTDLGRVIETRDLSRLLERAARLLDASGVIVWIGDPSGNALWPVVAHGYSDQALARMGSIPRDGDNATAAAYRAGELRTVSGDAGAYGAVVAPLMAPGGCIGVLTAELRHGGEMRDAVRAVVSIIAAQLSTIVAAPPAASSGAAQARG
jgi:CHASE3 domain sensor protein